MAGQGCDIRQDEMEVSAHECSCGDYQKCLLRFSGIEPFDTDRAAIAKYSRDDERQEQQDEVALDSHIQPWNVQRWIHYAVVEYACTPLVMVLMVT